MFGHYGTLRHSSKILAVSAICPHVTDDDATILCSANYTADPATLFSLPPVTSLSTKLTYRNRFCAQCHNDTDIQPWSPIINCYNQTVDLNFLNSYDEIFTKADTNNCSIMYHELNDKSTKITCDSPVRTIGKCNITGTWQQYDADIEMACSLNMMSIGYTHRNIFCQMCNPPEKMATDYKLITEKAWYTMAEGNPMLDACFQYDEIPMLHPYKNAFCYFLSTRNEPKDTEVELYQKVMNINGTIQFNGSLIFRRISPLPIFDPSSEMRQCRRPS